MFSMLLVLFFAVFAVHVVPQFNLVRIRVKAKPIEEPPSSVIRLFDGPNDGQVHKIRTESGNLPHYFVAPYLPLDEDGNPAPDESQIMHRSDGMVYVRPSLAYYQQVTDEDYFYVRDINENELNKIRVTGELPKFKVEE